MGVTQGTEQMNKRFNSGDEKGKEYNTVHYSNILPKVNIPFKPRKHKLFINVGEDFEFFQSKTSYISLNNNKVWNLKFWRDIDNENWFDCHFNFF